MITKLMATIRIGTDMNVMTWTVFNLMTDTAVLEKDRALAEEVWDNLKELEAKLDAIIARESSYA
jgi:hypothetical protein